MAPASISCCNLCHLQIQENLVMNIYIFFIILVQWIIYSSSFIELKLAFIHMWHFFSSAVNPLNHLKLPCFGCNPSTPPKTTLFQPAKRSGECQQRLLIGDQLCPFPNLFIQPPIHDPAAGVFHILMHKIRFAKTCCYHFYLGAKIKPTLRLASLFLWQWHADTISRSGPKIR